MLPRVEIIAIGDELLSGLVVDTNSAWLGQQAQTLGATIAWRQVVPDDIAEIGRAFELARGRATLCVVCGGLGPTVDDMTAEAAATFLGETTHESAEALAQVEARRTRSGRMLTALDTKQAMLPPSATVLENPVGTAPAFSFASGECRFFCFPGVPREFRHLCEQWFLSELRSGLDDVPVVSTWKFFGLTESQLASQVAALDTSGLTLHFRPHFPEIHLWVQSDDSARVATFAAALDAALGHRCFGDGDARFAAQVNAALRACGFTLSTAESCTGGMIAQMVTSASGSSDVFTFGAVTYSNEAKRDRLGVDDALLAEFGAVSEPVVRAMARGVRELAGTSLGVAVSGVAGPGGGSPDKPVGTIHVALSAPGAEKHRLLRLPFDRERNRVATAYAALELVRRYCKQTLAH